MPYFNWNRPSPHCSHAAEIFYFRLICIHLNAGNMYILYIHTGASNLFIINDDVVSFFYLLHLYVSCLPHFTSLFLWESVSLLARFDCLASNFLRVTAQFTQFAFVPVVPVSQSRCQATQRN